MHRKAQFYLVAVLLICIVIFTFLSATTKTSEAKKVSFEKLWENCYKESAFVFNQAVKNNENIFAAFDDFADDFKSYSRAIDSRFGFVYLATNLTGATRIKNLLESDVNVSAVTESHSTQLAKGSQLTDETDYVNLTVNNIKYDFDTTRKPNIQFLFWQQADDDIWVKQK